MPTVWPRSATIVVNAEIWSATSSLASRCKLACSSSAPRSSSVPTAVVLVLGVGCCARWSAWAWFARASSARCSAKTSRSSCAVRAASASRWARSSSRCAHSSCVVRAASASTWARSSSRCSRSVIAMTARCSAWTCSRRWASAWARESSSAVMDARLGVSWPCAGPCGRGAGSWVDVRGVAAAGSVATFGAGSGGEGCPP